MPVEISNPSYINPGAVAGGEAAVITVANEAARLALLAANAQGRIVKQTGDFSVWCLKPNGSPSNSADWELIGYFSIGTMASQNANAVAITGGSISGVSLANITWTDQAAARAALGLGNVNNTADASKPVSTAQQAAIDAAKNRANHTGTQSIATVSGLEAALAAKAPLASPSFTGIPTGPTAAPGTNTTQFATTAFVMAAISGLSSSGAAWGFITGSISSQPDLAAALDGLQSQIDDKVSADAAVFTGSVSFTGSTTFSYGASPDAAAAHRAALNAQIAPIQRTSPPLNTGGYAKSTLSFTGPVTTSGAVNLNGVAINFATGSGPFAPYTLAIDSVPYSGTVAETVAAAFVASTINRNQGVFACQAVDNGDGTVFVVALDPGPGGNSIATTESLSAAAWSGTALSGGSLGYLGGDQVFGTPGKIGQECVVTIDNPVFGYIQSYQCVRESPVLWQRTGSLEIRHIGGLQSALDAKQSALVSGTNIKTLGGQSLLGSGNIAGVDVVGLVGKVSVSSNITIGEAHYGKLLVVSGARTITVPSTPPDGVRIALYLESDSSAAISGAVVLDASGFVIASPVFYPAQNYLILEGIGDYWVARSLAAQGIGSTAPVNASIGWTARDSSRDWVGVASSADGTKLVAVVSYGQIYTSTDSGATWTARDSSRNWGAVASSSDGTKLVAAVIGGQIYTSTDSGVTWTARETARNWSGVASSADGMKLVALEFGGQIHASTDGGVTWTPRESSRNWKAVASSADGTKLVAVVLSGQIYTSTDSGVTWTARESARDWIAVASSSDGTKLVAANNLGQIYTSSNSGGTWTARESARDWIAVASSSEGTKLVAVVYNGLVYTSTDSGVTWTARGSSLSWYGVASSSDGTKLVAVVTSGQIYTSASGGADISATPAPPYIRTHGGYLYIQENGIWMKAPLSIA